MLPLPLLAPLKLIGGMLAKVPWYAWLIAGALALAAWNRHQARSVRAEFDKAKQAAAAERADSEVRAASEYARRVHVQMEVVDAANLKAAALQRSLAASADAGRRLREELAAQQARFCTGDPAVAGSREAAAAAADLHADVSRRLEEATDGVAEFAERAAIAGEACFGAYGALKPPK